MRSQTRDDTFPRQYARTQRFTLGEPRTFSISPDGTRVVFLRSRSGSDPVNCLWELDLETSTERLIVDPLALAESATSTDLSPEELARRERLREAGGGITAYSVDDELEVFAFAISGQLFVGNFATASTRHIPSPGPVFDPRLDPTGRRIAFVCDGELFCVDSDRDVDRTSNEQVPHLVAGRSLFDEDRTVSWGVADFIAAEEMNRYRGFWWSTDGRRLAVARVDESPVSEWTIADPAQPWLPGHTVRYPAAGTANAHVSLSIFHIEGVADSSDFDRRDVEWNTSDLPYLADVSWSGPDDVVVTVQSRDQKTVVIGRATWNEPQLRASTAETSDTWVDLVTGSPSVLADGTIITVADRDGVNRLIVAGSSVSPDELDVRHIVTSNEGGVVFAAIDVRRPECWGIWHWDRSKSSIRSLTPSDGVHSATVAGPTVVIRRSSLSQERATVSVTQLDNPQNVAVEIESFAEAPLLEPNVQFVRAGERGIPCALILPRNVAPGTRLPVLMDPYGGPHAQRVVDSYAAHCTSQWFADQGYAVIVADGRGTPGLGTRWERSVHRDLATEVLQDQVDALQALALDFPVLDTERVGIRGWSFGGYLAALAVLRRPDVFHAAIAGAPVTDWKLYDTHYTERYLGDPNVDAGPYTRTSLIELADRLTRPLLLIHGLADDNVVAAHTLQLSSALLAAGKPHEVLPLSGVTHMTPQAEVAENLLLHQLDFLRRALS